MENVDIGKIVAIAIAEDIGDGDHTSRACIESATQGSMRLLVKQPCVLAGMLILFALLLYANGNDIVRFFFS